MVVYDVFAVAIKELRSNSSNRKNVAERKPHKGACADCGFSQPSRPQGGVHIPSC